MSRGFLHPFPLYKLITQENVDILQRFMSINAYILQTLCVRFCGILGGLFV